MTLRLTLTILAVLAIGAGVWVSGVVSPAPAPAEATQDSCNTCDARQQGKARLREHLHSKTTAEN